MATPRQVAQLKAALSYDEADRDGLAQDFLEHKIAVYIDTLGELADTYGYDYGGRIDLADDVIASLATQARAHADSVVATFNSEVAAFVDRNAEADRDTIIDLVDQWAAARADSHSPVIAITEAYEAHADATASFWQAAGVEPEFDFGVHGPEDAPPQCDICEALVALSPHPLSRVLEVGVPHHQCRQSWQEVGVDAAGLPDEIQLGAATGGILGTDPFITRHGNDRQAAVRAIADLVAGDAGTVGP